MVRALGIRDSRKIHSTISGTIFFPLSTESVHLRSVRSDFVVLSGFRVLLLIAYRLFGSLEMLSLFGQTLVFEQTLLFGPLKMLALFWLGVASNQRYRLIHAGEHDTLAAGHRLLSTVIEQSRTSFDPALGIKELTAFLVPVVAKPKLAILKPVFH